MLSAIPRRFVRCCALALTLVIPLSAGCGANKGKAVVTGTVTYKGKTLKAGIVSFQTADNRVGSARIDATGHYAVNDAPVGEAKITVTMPSAPLATGKPPGGMAMKPPPGMEPPKETTSSDPRDYIPLPPKYAALNTTDLTFTVKSGENTHDITLNP
jgi:hypothetical protein